MMPANLQQLETAFMNAHNAGDTQAASVLAAEIKRQRAGATPAASAPAPAPAAPQQDGPGILEKLHRGMMDPIDGGAQLLTRMLPQGVVDAGNRANNWLADKTGLVGRLPEGGVDQQVRDNERQYQARRTAAGESGFDGYRTIGNAISPVNLAAAMRAGPTILGGMVTGAASGALEPTMDENFWSAKARQVSSGGFAGAVVPSTMRAAKVLRAALVDPFTEAGRNKIVGRTLNTAASDKNAAMANMTSRTGATPGFMPTVGQAADDAGLAALERGSRAIDPAGFGDVDRSQRGALVSALRGIAKTPEERSTAVAARDAAVKPLYTAAKASEVEGDDTINALLKRPSMGAAQGRAGKIAAERGETFGISSGTPAQNIDTGLLDASGNPIMQSVASNPGKLKGAALHDLKMGLDDAIGNPGLGGMQGAERDAALGTKDAYLDWLGKKIPAYAQAKNTYAEMSRPINQMDVGQELYNRFVPALADGAEIPFKARADGFAQALRNGDQLTRNVTGMKGATLESVMDPAQIAALNGVKSDAAMIGAGQTAGRGVGSDTVQKMAMSNLIDQSGLPSWIGSLAPLRPAGGWLKTAGDILYTKNDETMRHLLADVLKDPARAAEAMKAAGVPPSKYAEILRAATQAGAVGAATTNQ